MNLPGYDRWKLSYPSHWDGPFVCDDCDEEMNEDDIHQYHDIYRHQVCRDCYEKFMTEPG